jgi:hypothetical protein
MASAELSVLKKAKGKGRRDCLWWCDDRI